MYSIIGLSVGYMLDTCSQLFTGQPRRNLRLPRRPPRRHGLLVPQRMLLARLRPRPVSLLGEKAVRLAQNMQVGPCIPVGTQL